MLGNVRETLDANADEYGDAPATQPRIDDDEGGHGELSKTIVCKTLAEYGCAAYQPLSMTEIQREMPRGIPMRDSRRADHLGRIRDERCNCSLISRALSGGASSRNADAERARQPRPGNAHESA